MIKIAEQNFLKLFPFIIPAFFVMGLIRMFVFLQYDSVLYQYKTSYLIQGCILDLWVILIFGGLFIALCTILQWLFKRTFYFVFHTLLFVFLIAQFGLSQYFLIMQIPLDESIFFQRIQDLVLVIDLKNYLKWYYILIVLFVAIGYTYIGRRLVKLNFNFKIFGSLLLLSILTYPFSYYESSKLEKTYTMNNPLRYFLKKTQDYLGHSNSKEDNLILPNDFKALNQTIFPLKPEDANYPMFHSLQINKEWNDQFNLDAKNPPHLVFILVESLNNYFIGEEGINEIGNHMPFLNELTRKSIYFPNTFSTCERTLNVLPAVCSSLPNAPDQSAAMMLDPLPKLFSLQSILSNHYYSRFYCGVDLSFTNMGSFMSSIQTDYLVNHWEKDALNFQKEYYHDGVVLKQTLMDQIPEGKTTMDFILTYNTHEPFRYPNSNLYTQRVLKALENKNLPLDKKEHIHKNAAKIGSYTYLDDELKKYFAKREKTKEHKNTIYFIVGDHGSELINFKPFDRFRTSLIVYSPLLKKPSVSKAIVSHLDIMPSVLSLLSSYANFDIPTHNACSGIPLKLSQTTTWNRTLVFKGNNLKNFAILDGQYFYDQGTLFRFNNKLEFQTLDLKNKQDYYETQLSTYDKLVRYLLVQDRLIPQLYAYSYSKKAIYIPVYEYSMNKTQTIKDQFIPIGKFNQSLKQFESIKINLILKVKEKDIDEGDLPDLICSVESLEGTTPELLYYKGNSFKKQNRTDGYYELSYETIIDTKSFANRKKLKFGYYLYQSIPKPLIFKQIETKIYAVKKK